jgi:hypothetical protein
VGVASWTVLSTSADNHENFTEWALGYARHERSWKILIKFSNGNHHHPDDVNEEQWPFDEEPTFIKAKAIDALPALVEALAAVAEKTADKLARKTALAESLADAVKSQLGSKK